MIRKYVYLFIYIVKNDRELLADELNLPFEFFILKCKETFTNKKFYLIKAIRIMDNLKKRVENLEENVELTEKVLSSLYTLNSNTLQALKSVADETTKQTPFDKLHVNPRALYIFDDLKRQKVPLNLITKPLPSFNPEHLQKTKFSAGFDPKKKKRLLKRFELAHYAVDPDLVKMMDDKVMPQIPFRHKRAIANTYGAKELISTLVLSKKRAIQYGNQRGKFVSGDILGQAILSMTGRKMNKIGFSVGAISAATDDKDNKTSENSIILEDKVENNNLDLHKNKSLNTKLINNLPERSSLKKTGTRSPIFVRSSILDNKVPSHFQNLLKNKLESAGTTSLISKRRKATITWKENEVNSSKSGKVIDTSQSQQIHKDSSIENSRENKRSAPYYQKSYTLAENKKNYEDQDIDNILSLIGSPPLYTIPTNKNQQIGLDYSPLEAPRKVTGSERDRNFNDSKNESFKIDMMPNTQKETTPISKKKFSPEEAESPLMKFRQVNQDSSSLSARSKNEDTNKKTELSALDYKSNIKQSGDKYGNLNRGFPMIEYENEKLDPMILQFKKNLDKHFGSDNVKNETKYTHYNSSDIRFKAKRDSDSTTVYSGGLSKNDEISKPNKSINQPEFSNRALDDSQLDSAHLLFADSKRYMTSNRLPKTETDLQFESKYYGKGLFESMKKRREVDRFSQEENLNYNTIKGYLGLEGTTGKPDLLLAGKTLSRNDK